MPNQGPSDHQPIPINPSMARWCRTLRRRDSIPRWIPRTCHAITASGNTRPFVTAPPCRFDAYDMVSPPTFSSVIRLVSCRLVESPACALTYAPPTMTPNMAPGLYGAEQFWLATALHLRPRELQRAAWTWLFGQPTAYVSGNRSGISSCMSFHS